MPRKEWSRSLVRKQEGEGGAVSAEDVPRGHDAAILFFAPPKRQSGSNVQETRVTFVDLPTDAAQGSRYLIGPSSSAKAQALGF